MAETAHGNDGCHLADAIDKLDWGMAALMTAVAAVPRLTFLGLAEFKLDEATHYSMAYALTRGEWRWVGSTASVGFPKPPLFVYALAVPMAVTRDPRVITSGRLTRYHTPGSRR